MHNQDVYLIGGSETLSIRSDEIVESPLSALQQYAPRDKNKTYSSPRPLRLATPKYDPNLVALIIANPEGRVSPILESIHVLSRGKKGRGERGKTG